MKKQKVILTILVLIIIIFSLGLTSSGQVVYTNYPLIRFHVLANSDSPVDQALKLKVRDAVVKEVTPLLKNTKNKEEARKIIDANYDLIKATAQSVIEKNGYSYKLKVFRGNYDFPEKTYYIKERKNSEVFGLTLPAGRYEAVRIVIGDGKGANWWCVLFPPLCFVNPEEGSREKELGKALAVKYDLDNKNRVEYRLKVVDWFRQVKNHITI